MKAIATSLVLLAAVRGAVAQDVLDTASPEGARSHDVARNPRTGDCVAVWVSVGTDSRTIIVRRWTGTTWDTPVGIEMYSATASEVAIAYGAWSESQDGYLVLWRAPGGSSVGHEIFGRILNSQLTPLGDSFRVSDLDDAGADTSPAAAWNNGTWLVVWAHNNLAQSQGRSNFSKSFDVNEDIYARYVSPSGMSSPSFPVADDAIDAKNPSVAAAGGAAWMATWEEHPGPGRPGRIWGAPILANSKVGLIAPYGVGTGANQVRPRIASKTDGSSLITWEVTYRTTPGNSTASQQKAAEETSTLGISIGARRVQADGVYAGPAFTLEPSARGTPSVVHVPQRQAYLVVYESLSTANGSHDIRAQWCDEQTGETRGTATVLSSSEDERSPRATVTTTGEPFTVAQKGNTDTKAVVARVGADLDPVPPTTVSSSGGGRSGLCAASVGALPLPWMLALVLSLLGWATPGAAHRKSS